MEPARAQQGDPGADSGDGMSTKGLGARRLGEWLFLRGETVGGPDALPFPAALLNKPRQKWGAYYGPYQKTVQRIHDDLMVEGFLAAGSRLSHQKWCEGWNVADRFAVQTRDPLRRAVRRAQIQGDWKRRGLL